jgi:uncharacterized protein (TIGR02996 family)
MAKMVQTKVETAASSAEEADFLAKIAADLGNHDQRLVYADWLEERGEDVKAIFVRQFVKATRTLEPTTKVPIAESLPKTWLDMLGVPIFAGLIEYQLLHVKDIALRLARPVVAIKTTPTVEKQLRVGESKFGGSPDLPMDVEWPRCEDHPLSFLGQLALSDLRLTQAGRHLPADGLLSFFAMTEPFQPPALPRADEPDDIRVFHYPSSTALVRRPLPQELVELQYPPNDSRPCRVSLRETWDVPEATDTGIPELDQGETNWQFSNLLRWSFYDNEHHLLGYSIHARTDNTAPGPDWRQLITFTSDDHLGWNWCDGEHLDVYIQEDDLRQHQFHRVYGYAS